MVSTVLEYGSSPILAGDKVHVMLPNENVNTDFRVECAEYRLTKDCFNELEITLNYVERTPPASRFHI